MAKTAARPRPKEKPQGRKRNRPPTYWERHRRTIVLLFVIAAAGLGFLILKESSPEGPQEAGSAFTGGDFHSMVRDPGRRGVIYAGGHQAVGISTDGGKNWQQIRSLENADAMGWAFLDGRVFVGGHPGLSVSEDGGKTFEQRNDGLPATDIHSLGAGTSVLYAGSPQTGFIASTDGGRSWEIRNPSAGRSFMGRIIADPRDEAHIFAPDMAGGVAESNDGGRTWRDRGGIRAAMWVSLDPSEPLHIVASGRGEAAESRDAGKTWRLLSMPKGASIAEIDPHDVGVLYAGIHDGERATVKISRDGGQTWTAP